MTKLIYPNDGIYKYCKDDIQSGLTNLSSALYNCNLDVPSGFSYKSYLSGLDNTLRNYYNELQAIDSKLQKSDNNYDVLDSNLSSDVKKMAAVKIKSRDRMIV